MVQRLENDPALDGAVTLNVNVLLLPGVMESAAANGTEVTFQFTLTGTRE